VHQAYHAACVAVAACVLAGCNAQPQQEPARLQLAQRPDVVQDTILVEGLPQTLTARLLLAEELDPPFSTYVPDGLNAVVEAHGDSGSVRFSAAFAGREEPNAYMHVRLYPSDTDLLAAREVVAGFLRSRRPQDDPMGGLDIDEPQEPEQPPDWGLEAHRFDYAGDGNVAYVGRIVLAQYRDRFFHVLTHYPAEYGDGMGPRLDYVLRHWRWEDTGQPLVP
jgi:hypothetical protein